MLTQKSSALTAGFMVVHANLPEQLRALCTAWMAAYPLDVFEAETILVQSNGIAQWLKLALAAEPAADGSGGLGIACGLRLAMPHRFVWQLYRWLLPGLAIPEQCAFDKDQLHWRLLRLLPELLQRAEFSTLAHYLADDTEQRKVDQLALKLADLFDQYQVYRADWLLLWQQGDDVLVDAHGQRQPLSDDNRWQAALWRAILADMQPEERRFSRAALQQECIRVAATFSQTNRPPLLPRRVMLFGISSMSQQSLEALAAIAPYTQILLAVHNPCQHYWADIIADKDLFRAMPGLTTKRRQQPKPDSSGHPLLAAWGKQGRDYIRLLDQFDQTQQFRQLFRGERIDLFSDYDGSHLLGQLQQDILELRDLAQSRQHWPQLDRKQAQSLCFARSHSIVRELEVLHDDLLAQFSQDPTLQFSDIMVMVPDINEYAAAIHAVFGRYRRDDDRCIPFTIADQAATVQQPMLQALQYLLQIRQQRFYVSDIVDLLQVPELAAKFELDAQAISKLSQWLMQAGAHWGLHSEQRQSLGIRYDYQQFSLFHALQRMLLGYAVGDDTDTTVAEQGGFDLEELSGAPLGAVQGLEAVYAGQLALLLQQLDNWWRLCATAQTPQGWYQQLLQLLDDFFHADTEQSLLLVQQLRDELGQWQQSCQQARLQSALALPLVADAWLGQFERNSLQQRFLSGAVNFASLLPMRAIPFRQVHLLGMQDGAFPRVQRRQDFDLMAAQYRPGDRSRRDDDRYLFLEALLSARQRLRISWLGRSVHDNSEREPSVLVAQLRQHLARGWQLKPDDGTDLLAVLTEDFPLKPYSQRYLSGELQTWQREWRSFYQPAVAPQVPEVLPFQQPEQPLDLTQLADFLRDPVRCFFQQRLQVYFPAQAAPHQDDEAFALDGLSNWQLQQQLYSALSQHIRLEPAQGQIRPEQLLEQQMQRAIAAGLLPVGAAGELVRRELMQLIPAQLRRFANTLSQSQPLSRDFQRVDFACVLDLDGAQIACPVQDWLKQLRQDSDGVLWQTHLQAEALQRDGLWQCRPLLQPWLAAVLSAAAGQPVRQYIVAPDADLCLPALAVGDAQLILQQLVRAYLQGQQQPLPFAFTLASVLLQSKADDKQLQKLQLLYEGTSFSQGLLGQNAYLRRAFASFDVFWQPELSPLLATQLLGPLLQALQQTAASADPGVN
ncbi:MAG: exodeoxyribonuclease V subunit gamma [Rheinheimera sp.]|nr:exodeoxyribonuclease V subunit gamma [Rheinheimera sp.]